MTTLIAWISIDQRAPSAFYLASDSRISWRSSRSRWDAGRKLFLCRRFPDIFGYAGDVLFPALVLGQITEAADSFLLFRGDDAALTRHEKFVNAIKSSFSRRHNTTENDFLVLHGARDNSGSKAEFRIWQLSFAARTRGWSDTEIKIPTSKSTQITALGSGAGPLKTHSRSWESSEQGGTSRAIFSAFCDSIRSKSDPCTGGIPQLVGMYHTRMPQAFGIVRERQRYYHGFPLPNDIDADGIEWRDELFQRVDGQTLVVLKGAQRHVRPKLMS